MSFAPYTLTAPHTATPLIISSPHSGRLYPADFAYACPLPLLRQAEDAFVDQLVTGAVDAGAALITAEFPRSYIDLNRAEDDIDPAVLCETWPQPLNPGERTLQGLGLVRRLCANGVAVYGGGLTVETVRQRITHCYRPYHAALDRLMTERVTQCGQAFLIDAHSMPCYGAERPGIPRPDFVLGDRDGGSCAAHFTTTIAAMLQEMGYSIALNDPYKGQEILRRHGNPAQGRHALQLEINRRLYLNETTLEKTAGFETLRRDLTMLFKQLVVGMTTQTQMAAE